MGANEMGKEGVVKRWGGGGGCWKEIGREVGIMGEKEGGREKGKQKENGGGNTVKRNEGKKRRER